MRLMAIHFNQSTVAPVVSADGVARQPLLNKQRVPGILFELDRLTVQPGATRCWRLRLVNSAGFR